MFERQAGPCAGLLGVDAAYGEGKPGSLGTPALALIGAPALGATPTLRLGVVPAGAAAVLFLGTSPASLPFDGGTLWVDPVVAAPLPPPPSNATLSIPLPLPADEVLCGLDVYLQAMFADPGAAGPLGTAQTQGLHLRLGE